VIGNLLDSLIGVMFPGAALRNTQRRVERQQVLAAAGRHQSMEKMLGSNQGPYEAGNVNRTNRRNSAARITENEAPRENIYNLRGRAWLQFRNNPQARKTVRTLQSKVIGKSLTPRSQATTRAGEPFTEFRDRVVELWKLIDSQIDYRGAPARGGQSMVGLHRTALQAAILSGGCLYRLRRVSRAQQRRGQLTIPLQLQLINIDRLDGRTHDSDSNFYGIEVDADGRRAAYHILDRRVADARGGITNGGSVRVPVTFAGGDRLQIGHLFLEDDIDQLDGTPWGAAAMARATIRNGYEISEAESAEAAACIGFGYRRSSGQSQLGLANPNALSDSLTDPAGNPITHLQPKMVIDLGATGDIVPFNPGRPNPTAAEFIRHLISSEAVAVPGVKSSSLTGDYRQSSFSSERSADNDTWTEIDQLQEWFYAGFTTPIYREVVIEAVEAGFFDDVPGFSPADFESRRVEYLGVEWQGPVAKSINPKDDAAAARSRIRNGQSSPQIEAAAAGQNFLGILDQFSEVIEEAERRNLPDDVWRQMLGMDQQDAEQDQSDGDDPPPAPPASANGNGHHRLMGVQNG
jgi:lambda family phage portal protein